MAFKLRQYLNQGGVSAPVSASSALLLATVFRTPACKVLTFEVMEPRTVGNLSCPVLASSWTRTPIIAQYSIYQLSGLVIRVSNEIGRAGFDPWLSHTKDYKNGT